MKVTIDAKALASILDWTSRALPRKSTIPLLEAIVLDAADGDQLTASAYDYEVAAVARAAVVDGSLPRCAVHGATLAKIAGQLSGDVTLTLDDTKLTVRSGRKDRYTLAVMPIEDYPSLPVTPPVVGQSDGLCAAAVRASAACATDTTVPALAAILIRADGDQLTVASTNRFLGTRTVLPWSGKPMELLVRGHLLATFAKAIAGPVTVGANAQHLSLTSGGRTVVLLATDTALFPGPALGGALDDCVTRAELDGLERGGFLDVRCDALLDAVKRASVAGTDAATVHIATAGDSASIVGNGVAADVELTIPGAVYEGATISTKFQAVFLAAVVATLDQPVARLMIPDNVARVAARDRAAPIYVVGVPEIGADAADGAQSLVMPMMR